MNYKILKNNLYISSSIGQIQIPLRLGLDAHLFARTYTKLLSNAIEQAPVKDTKGVVLALFELVEPDKVDSIISDIFSGMIINGEPLDIQSVYLPLNEAFAIGLIILTENCKPLLESKYQPSRVVSKLRQITINAPNRSLENVSTSFLSDIKLLILGLVNSPYNGNHTYQYFIEECPLQSFYDLLEYKEISESIKAESYHTQEQAAKQKPSKR